MDQRETRGKYAYMKLQESEPARICGERAHEDMRTRIGPLDQATGRVNVVVVKEPG